MSLYTIFFEDGTNFWGGNIDNTHWLEIPNKPIKKLIYILPSGKKLIYEKYDTYYHFVEATQDIIKKGQKQLEYAYLICKQGTKCEVMKIDLRTKKIITTILDETDNFIQSLNKIGWK